MLASNTDSRWLLALKNEFMYELLAWRLVKAFCKPKFWNERVAIRCVKTYTYYPEPKMGWKKFRIIPLYSFKGKFGKMGKRLYDKWSETMDRIVINKEDLPKFIEYLNNEIGKRNREYCMNPQPTEREP